MNFLPIYLASASPRRHEILTLMGVPHEVLRVPAPDGEDEPRLPGESPAIYVCRTARDKALHAAAWLAEQHNTNATHAQRPILCADTTVILDDDILGKPATEQHARDMLARLSGRTHAVHTAIALMHNGQLYEDVSITTVRFKPLTVEEIRHYCSSGEPMGKAGAYGIQGLAGMFVASITGSYTGVMGLPMFETGKLLTALPAQKSE
ncbi:septum formation inhibitor Maf [Alcaligenaceae bacterium]|nr:septum formation inhibitor Maf [Alcaligenaceae bacterium]